MTEPASDPARRALARARSRVRTQSRGTGRSTTRRTSTTGWGGSSGAAGGSADRRSGPGPDPRDPQPLGANLSRLVDERGWQTDVAVGGTLSRWNQIVGEEIAAHAQPDRFDDGILTIRADSTAWATQLRLLITQVRARLDAELGAGVVSKIVVTGPSTPTWRRGRLNVPGRGPRDTYG